MKNRSFKKIAKYILLTLSVLLIFSAIYIYSFLNKSKPKLDGEIKLDILKEKVTVTRDDKGIPTIIANNDSDLYKAQGFVQAQDRLFQMEMARRQASGRLSEIVGEKALDNDKKFLTFSLLKAAKESYAEYSDESKKILQDYADGVNAFIDLAKEKSMLPYEFKILGFVPEKWTPIDSLVIGKYMAYDLGGHWSYQVFNNWALNNIGENKLKELLPEDFYKSEDNLKILNLNKYIAADIDEKLANMKTPHIENGSNNWVISGKKTKSGKPLLADDPHLGLATPSIWYQMNLISPSMHVQGVIFAGIPGIILGNNKDIAWGVTNVGPDVQDIYIEKVNPNNPYQFEYNGKWYDAKSEKHNIKVKGKEDVQFEVIYTKNGPIIDELVKPVNDKNLKFSMQWTALDPSKELEAIVKLNKAKNWEEFEDALTLFKTPAQNFVFADKNGFIAFKANGNIPIRKKGSGALPVPGYTDEYGWKGYIPFEELPKIINPESGYIATANTNTIGEYKYHLSNIWAQPYRKNRIDEVLSSKNDFTFEDMQNLQTDMQNLHAKEFLPKFLEIIDSSINPEIYNSLKEWNYDDDKNLSAPLIFDRWINKIHYNIYMKYMNKDVYKFFKFKSYLTDRILRNSLSGKSSEFIEEQGGLKALLEKSLIDAISELESKYGKNSNNWKWGDFHKLYFQHPIGKGSKLLGYFLNSKTVPVNGSGVTVKAARQDEKGYVNHGASWRFVYDFGTNYGYHVVSPGQSGHFMSPYYNDQVQNWADGKYIKQNLEDFIIKHNLILIP